MNPAKKPQSQPAQTSIFGEMKKVARLNKNIAKAKKVIAVRDFEGPDGDYICKLSRTSTVTKDGVMSVIFEFRVNDGSEMTGQKITIWFSFRDEEVGLKRTLEEVQEEFFMTLQLLGIDTEEASEAEMDAYLSDLIKSETPVTISVYTSVSKSGKSKGKSYRNFKIKGVSKTAEEVEETEYLEEDVEYEEVEEEVEEEAEEEPTEEEEVEETEEDDEWEEEEEVEEDDKWEEDEEETEEELEEDPELPSTWVGYAMVYKDEEVEVLAGDDKTMKCTIKHGKKKLIVPFSSLSMPNE